jgi:hypothetical protein
MIHIDFDPDNHPERLTPEQLEWWNTWKNTADLATNEVVAAWEKFRADPTNLAYKKIFEKSQMTSVWGKLKDWLLENFFHDKCAYCETKKVRTTFHAEHFRPKAMVKSEDGKVKITDHDGKEIDHPGYFWLAFNWKNLLPSCADCNTNLGKGNQFPIPKTKKYWSFLKGLTADEVAKLKVKIRSHQWQDVYYPQPADLDELEGRLLLHPYFDDPSKHLRFDELGGVIAIGEGDDFLKGKLSMEVYNLTAGDIVTERMDAQLKAEDKFNSAYKFYRGEGHSVNDARLKAKNHVAGYIEGKEPYSAAVMDFFRAAFPEVFPKSPAPGVP